MSKSVYILKDEDGDVYSALIGIGPVDVQRAQMEVDKAVSAGPVDFENLNEEPYNVCAKNLGLAGTNFQGKATLMTQYLVQKCGAKVMNVTVWRCGL